jgi:hypothetical protein
MERHSTLEARHPASPGAAYWRQRREVAARLPRLRALADAVAHPQDLSPPQWSQLVSLTLDYEPDLVVEIGRGYGNSTCVFTEAVQGRTARVVSVCLSSDWMLRIVGRLSPLVPRDWFSPLDARVEDVRDTDFEALVGQAGRVLVFWDAHGFTVAERVLGCFLPVLLEREHLVVMHDLSDARYMSPASARYGGRPLWRANDWSGPRLRLGHIDTAVEQAVAIVDFCSRNQLALRSADESLRETFGGDTAREAEMGEVLGESFSLEAHWFYFSMNERIGEFTFPAVATAGDTADRRRNE